MSGDGYNPVKLSTGQKPEAVEPEEESYEEIDHPDHYGGRGNPYEAKKLIRVLGFGFFDGNALKYMIRAGKKPGQDKIKDLKKAVWYLKDEIRFLETGEY